MAVSELAADARKRLVQPDAEVAFATADRD
jgi:hypothetical protein